MTMTEQTPTNENHATPPGGVLVSSRANLPAPSPATTTSPAMAALEVELRTAQAIARAGECLPRQYREKPGAILLVQRWADDRGIDVLTAIQGVAFIDGKPVVDATLQRAMAARAGYDVRPTEVSDKGATVVVSKGGVEIGRASYTIEEAKRAGLASKKNWTQHPVEMCVARATTRALKWFAPEVTTGVHSEDEVDDADPVSVLAASPSDAVEGTPAAVEQTATPAPDAPAAGVGEPDIVDAEVVEEPPPGPSSDDEDQGDDPFTEQPPVELTVDDLKARLKSAKVTQGDAINRGIAIAGQLGVDKPATLAELVANTDVITAVVAWLDGGAE